MPEGDTIHRSAQGLSRALLGRTVVRFECVYPHVSRVDVDTPLAGQTIDAIRAVGKHLLITFSGGLTLRTHMRMNGSWHIYRPGERWRVPGHAMRVRIDTDAFVAVGFDVPEVELLSPRELERHDVLSALGPDLLSPEFDSAEALVRLRALSESEIGEALLNQRVMAGIGNVYKSEVLFACGINPYAKVGAVDDESLERVITTAKRLMRANVPQSEHAFGQPPLRRTTSRMDPAQRLWVYSRGGEPCRRCGTAIEFSRQGPHARVTYCCPRCQPHAG